MGIECFLQVYMPTGIYTCRRKSNTIGNCDVIFNFFWRSEYYDKYCRPRCTRLEMGGFKLRYQGGKSYQDCTFLATDGPGEENQKWASSNWDIKRAKATRVGFSTPSKGRGPQHRKLRTRNPDIKRAKATRVGFFLLVSIWVLKILAVVWFTVQYPC